MMSLFLYLFPFTLLFLFRCRFRFLLPFPFLFRIPDSGFLLFQTPKVEFVGSCRFQIHLYILACVMSCEFTRDSYTKFLPQGRIQVFF